MIQLTGTLFEAVQKAQIFSDSKTFVDAIPKIAPEKIQQLFDVEFQSSDFDLPSFVQQHFFLPEEGARDIVSVDSVKAYIAALWPVLERAPDVMREYDTLIPLKYPYVVPGGRFREIYYWDSYFTAEGLATIKRFDLIESMIKNFIDLQERVGLIPNGNRQYYRSRSQPPVLAYMVDILYREYGIAHIEKYIASLEKEHAFWMSNRAVTMPNGAMLNQYRDPVCTPRPEAYAEDIALAANLDEAHAKKLYQNIRSAAESGWDFSSRWLENPFDLKTIRTTSLVPIDLNALLYGVERLLSQYHLELDHVEQSQHYQKMSEQRRQTIETYMWCSDREFYFDFDLEKQQRSFAYTAAGIVPLFVQLSNERQAASIAHHIEHTFLREGGVVTSIVESGQQWDSPNGWAPLQWFAHQGLLHYGYQELACSIAARWMQMLQKQFAYTHRLMEKYNVCHPDKTAGGGEYAVQEGFGWTNGIALAIDQ